MWFLLGLAVGLLVGWNFLAQPEWVRDYVEKVRTKLGF